jgi:TonB-dependent starch-binding outer membrane protein SusC
MKISIVILVFLSFLCANSLDAQKLSKRFTITGTVVDSFNRPVANAFIMINNKQTDESTDSKGAYKIRVKRTDSIIGVISFVYGMKEQEIAGRTQIDFVFRTVAMMQGPDQKVAPHEDAVNTGYNKVKRENLTYPVSKLDGNDKKYKGYQTVYDMIAEIGGVQVRGTDIIVDGSQNLAGFVPALVLVDGTTVSSIDYLQPSAVKSIEVLKGASAAIYGSRGYGGVILITTKKDNK